MPPSVLHWFRRDLRMKDNQALNLALRHAAKNKHPLIPVFFLDPRLYSPSVCGVVRMRFVLESLHSLRKDLQNKCGLNLRVVSGHPTDFLPQLARQWNTRHVFWEEEYAPVEKQRDQDITKDLNALNISVTTAPGFTVYDPKVLLQEVGGPKYVPVSMKNFLSLVERVGDPKKPEEFDFEAMKILVKESKESMKEEIQDNILEIPSLSELGYEEDGDNANAERTSVWDRFPGGEEEGMARMDEFMGRNNGRTAAKFSKPATSPAAFSPRDTTVLSPYLALGVVSSRIFHVRLREMESRMKVAEMPQTRLWGQLMWREHFWLLANCTENFHSMKGNTVCRQIDWDTGKEAEERLKRWEEGNTGFPWIDGLMRQLREEGFVHHLGRHSLACFLTRGDLWVSWEKGAAVFEKFLIDYDYALNSANWMWLSCSAFFVMYYRVYSPVAFAKKWDVDGEFIRRYVPVLKQMPTKYIHEPWKAPIEVQRRSGCIIGKDYPKPMVDHGYISKVNIQRMKEAYAKKEFGKLDQSFGESGNKKNRKVNKNSQVDPGQGKKARNINQVVPEKRGVQDAISQRKRRKNS